MGYSERDDGTDVGVNAFCGSNDRVHDGVDLIFRPHDEDDVVVEGDGRDVLGGHADPLARVDALTERGLEFGGVRTVGAEVDEGVGDGADAGCDRSCS